MSNIIAVIWDYDGTLVDTRFKNLSVQKKLIRLVTGKTEDEFPALKSVANYQVLQDKIINWQDQYRNHFGMTESQVAQAGKLWSELQSLDTTDTPLYIGLKTVLEKTSTIPQGVFSQNSKQQIINTLDKHGVINFFREIIGYEDLTSKEQKPAAEGLIKIIYKLSPEDSGIVLFIGDHITDFKCVINTNEYYRINCSDTYVYSVGVNYTAETDPGKWEIKPDFIIDQPSDLLQIITKLSKN